MRHKSTDEASLCTWRTCAVIRCLSGEFINEFDRCFSRRLAMVSVRRLVALVRMAPFGIHQCKSRDNYLGGDLWSTWT